MDRPWAPGALMGCIEFTGYRQKNGYGVKRRGPRTFLAHRLAYEDAFGPIPEGMCVCHRCDNPACVNPEHLFLGTHEENMADMVRKGRSPKHSKSRDMRGVRNSRHKLTEETATWAMARMLAGEPQKSVAQAFGVSPVTINHLWTGKNWRHLFSGH